MSEIRELQKTYTVDMVCDKCGDGKMRFGGVVLTSNPAQYPHACNKCGHAVTYLKRYPYLEYVNEKV